MEQKQNNVKNNKSGHRIIISLLVAILCTTPGIVVDVYRDRQEKAKETEVLNAVVEYVSDKSNLTNERYFNDIESYITQHYYQKASIYRFKNIGEEVGNLQKTVNCHVEFVIEDTTIIMGVFSLTYNNIKGTLDYELSDCKVNLLNETVIIPGMENYIFCKQPFSLGLIDGTVYSNEYVGFSCDFDEKWSFSTNTTLKELMESTESILDNTQLGDFAKNYEQFYDLQAENIDMMTTINVLYTKQSLLDYLNFLSLDEEDIIDAAVEHNQGMLEEAYSNAGIKVSSIEKIKVTFLGNERYCIRTVGTLNDVPMYSIQLMNFYDGQYSVTLTLTSYIEDKTMSMLEMLYRTNQ